MPVTVENIGPPVDTKTIGEWVKRQTIAVAERVLREEVGQGFDNQPVVVTDGMPQRDYAQVRPFGRIEFIARTPMADAVRWALSELQKRSPVKTGRYAGAHMVLLNGEELISDIWGRLRSVKPDDRVQIVNPQPYAKKIEGRAASRKRGISGQRGLSPQAPGGVYRVVVQELVQRYGRSMFFDFKYVRLNTGLKYVRHGKGRRSKAGRDYVFPAIQFFIKPTGLPN